MLSMWRGIPSRTLRNNLLEKTLVEIIVAAHLRLPRASRGPIGAIQSF
jgi:hypothetical protein